MTMLDLSSLGLLGPLRDLMSPSTIRRFLALDWH